MWLAETTAVEAVSKLLATHPELIHEAQAAPAGGVDLFNPSGIDQYGQHSGWIVLDQMQTGGGAFVHRDGLSPQGHHVITNCRVPNVESQEQLMPLLWLYRRLIIDSPGAGRMRGGQSACSAMTPHQAHWLRAAVGGHGFESPTASGIFGGYPARCNERIVVRDSDFWQQVAAGRMPGSPADLTGTVEHTAAKAPDFRLRANDVLFWFPQAGGGWGDPLERDPVEVGADVRGGVISPATAARGYGVIMNADGSVDAAMTAVRRNEIRQARRFWPYRTTEVTPSINLAAAPTLALVGDVLRIVGTAGAAYTVCRCGYVLADANENWKAYAATHTADQADLGPHVRLHQELRSRMYACPGCGLLLDVETSRCGDEPLHDMEVLFDVG
jgi:N-methylhydantoinase B